MCWIAEQEKKNLNSKPSIYIFFPSSTSLSSHRLQYVANSCWTNKQKNYKGRLTEIGDKKLHGQELKSTWTQTSKSLKQNSFHELNTRFG